MKSPMFSSRARRRARTDPGTGASPPHQGGAAASRVRGRVLLAAFAGASAAAIALAPAFADIDPQVTVGAGMRASFDETDPSQAAPTPSPSQVPEANDFDLDSIRLYVNGSVLPQVKFTFDTEYEGSPPQGSNNVEVLDAIARFEFNDEVNIWAGRFLPPSDRANLYGPYYANQWGTYNDGVQDGYPSEAVGRDNGLAYWGQFNIVKVSVGAFDVPQTFGSSAVVWAGRVMVDLWDPEPGYYLNGTYYGEKDILAIGLAGQEQSNTNNETTTSDTGTGPTVLAYTGHKDAYSADFLLEKNLHEIGVFTVESEYAKYDHFGGYAANDSDGYYVLGSYLFPRALGIGKVQLLAKYAHADYSQFETSPLDDAQKTDDLEIGYIIKDFNARVSLYWIQFHYDNQLAGMDHRLLGLGVQLQM
jgi:hypothetical protein